MKHTDSVIGEKVSSSKRVSPLHQYETSVNSSQLSLSRENIDDIVNGVMDNVKKSLCDCKVNSGGRLRNKRKSKRKKRNSMRKTKRRKKIRKTRLRKH